MADLAAVAGLLNLLADGREVYTRGYPESDPNRVYLETQVATCRTLARILADPTNVNAGLWLPTSRFDRYAAARAELDDTATVGR